MTVFSSQWVSNNSSPVLTRPTSSATAGGATQNALTHVAVTAPTNAETVNAVAQASTYAPWSGMRRCNLWTDGTVTAYYGDRCYSDTDVANMGQAMVQVPKFWYSIDTSLANNVAFLISTTGTETVRNLNDSANITWAVHPAFVENGVTKNYIYVASYEAYYNAVTTKLESKAGVIPTDTLAPATFRTDAANNSAQWTMWTIQALAALQLLFIVEYANLDSQTVAGYGNGGTGGTRKNTGTTGSTGTNRGNDSYGIVANATTEMSYRGIENLWGNIQKYLDGANKAITTEHIWVKDFPPYSDVIVAPYTDTGAAVPAATLTTYWTKPSTALIALGLFLPDSTDTGDATQTHYFCDIWLTAAGTRTLCTEGMYGGAVYTGGIFAAGTKSGAQAGWGTRLQYHEV